MRCFHKFRQVYLTREYFITAFTFILTFIITRYWMELINPKRIIEGEVVRLWMPHLAVALYILIGDGKRHIPDIYLAFVLSDYLFSPIETTFDPLIHAALRTALIVLLYISLMRVYDGFTNFELNMFVKFSTLVVIWIIFYQIVLGLVEVRLSSPFNLILVSIKISADLIGILTFLPLLFTHFNYTILDLVEGRQKMNYLRKRISYHLQHLSVDKLTEEILLYFVFFLIAIIMLITEQTHSSIEVSILLLLPGMYAAIRLGYRITTRFIFVVNHFLFLIFIFFHEIMIEVDVQFLILIITLITNVTGVTSHESRRNRESAMQEKLRYQNLFDQSIDSIIVTNDRGRIIELNQSAQKLLGLNAELGRQSLIQDYIVTTISEEDIADVPYIVLLRDRDSNTKYGVASKLTINGLNHIIIHDVTEEKRIEHKLIESQKNEVLGKLTKSITHDIANLLFILQSNLEMARVISDNEEKESADIFSDITKVVDQALELNNRLIQFSKAKEFIPKEIDINAFIIAISAELTYLLGKSHQLHLDLDDDLNYMRIVADENQIEQIILNLVFNSRDASDSGVIILRTRLFDDKGEIAVIDEGHGIAPENLDSIFEPYFTTKEHGTGIGLMLVKGIVEKLDGSISVVSQVDRGSTFKILLPVKPQINKN